MLRKTILFPVIMLAGCVSLDAVDPDVSRDTVMAVLGSHDIYVEQDSALSDHERTTFLAASAEQRLVWEEAEEIPNEFIQPRLFPILDRFEIYVNSDADLSALEKRIYLRNAKLLREQASTK